MTETALENVRPQAKSAVDSASRSSRKGDSAFYGYVVLAAVLLAGWLLRDKGFINPEEGLGYWLGIAGASMMLVLLLYPLRKKLPVLRVFGPIRHWFRFHMMLGLLGPTLILFHSNFSAGSVNDRVALYCMLLVAGSGIVGRYIYARIHKGLYGRRTSLHELKEEMTLSLDNNKGIASLMPNLLTSLELLSQDLERDSVTRSIGARCSLRWIVRRFLVAHRLRKLASAELVVRAKTSTAVERDFDRLSRSANSYISSHVSLITRVAQFAFYDRLFSLWHVLHLPLFFMLVISASFHVLAVHMY